MPAWQSCMSDHLLNRILQKGQKKGKDKKRKAEHIRIYPASVSSNCEQSVCCSASYYSVFLKNNVNIIWTFLLEIYYKKKYNIFFIFSINNFFLNILNAKIFSGFIIYFVIFSKFFSLFIFSAWINCYWFFSFFLSNYNYNSNKNAN